MMDSILFSCDPDTICSVCILIPCSDIFIYNVFEDNPTFHHDIWNRVDTKNIKKLLEAYVL